MSFYSRKMAINETYLYINYTKRTILLKYRSENNFDQNNYIGHLTTHKLDRMLKLFAALSTFYFVLQRWVST